MMVTTTASRFIAKPAAEVYDVAVGPARLPEIFRGYGLVPGVRAASMVGGAKVAPGEVLAFEDDKGAKAFHRLDRLEHGVAYDYDLHGLSAPFSLLVRSGYARWQFVTEGAGTRVTWTYEFPLTSPLAYPPAKLVIGVFMHGAMERCLANLAKIVGG